MAIEAHTFIVAQQPTDPLKWVIPEKFQGRFCTARTLIGMGSIIETGETGRASGSKKKRSWSPPPGGCRAKSGGSNNPTVSCKLFNKGGCNWASCNRAHKCKDCGSKDHEQSACTKKKKSS